MTKTTTGKSTGLSYKEQVFRLEVSVDDAQLVQVTEGERQLGQVELDILLGEHNLLRQPSEEVAASQEVQDEVQLAFRLEGTKGFSVLAEKKFFVKF
jgi:hypothetical protein